MFWKLTALSAFSPVESILDKDNFTLEELLDEDDIIQECKASNSRLINFLRNRAQAEQLLHYIVDEPPEDAESKRTFKFPFIACEIFTCEIDVILKTLVEEEELMDLLFSFLEPNRPHCALLAGYFGKVVVCLMIRKTVPVLNYVQAHQDVFRRLVDLIGITSIMEVLIRLVGADDHVYSNSIDVMQWLADSTLLEMIVDKLSPLCPPEVHANAAETLCTITRSAPSALATKLSSSSFVERIFSHALEDAHSMSSLVHSLSVCISLLDPKRSAALSPLLHSFRGQHMYDPAIPVSPETVCAMLPKLGVLLLLLNVYSDEKVLPTTYGELRPPLGMHRLKIVEFVAVLLKSGNEAAVKELVNSGTIQHVIDLFFEYPYNNSLHHHVESIIQSCLESKNDTIVDHLLQDCDLIGKILKTDKQPNLSNETDKRTVTAAGKRAPRVGNIGHITRISNKLVQLRNSHSQVHTCLQENCEWTAWQTTVLHERDAVENVYRWVCGRPTALHDRTRHSDEEDLNDRDYDVAALANNISQALRSKIYGNEDAEEDHGAIDQDEDVYFDDESAEVVISSLRLGDEQGSSFTNSNWFAFQDDRTGGAPVGSLPSEMMEDMNLNGTANGGNSSSDDEVVVGEDDELAGSKGPDEGTSSFNTDSPNGFSGSSLNPENEKVSTSHSHVMGSSGFETPENVDGLNDRPLPDCVGLVDSSDMQFGGSSVNPFDEVDGSNAPKNGELVTSVVSSSSSRESMLPNGFPAPTCTTSDGSAGSDASQRSVAVPSLFEEDVEFMGVELEGTEKAMEQALKEGIVGEAGPLKRAISPKAQGKDNSDEGGPRMEEFNDANYWRVDQEVAVLE